MRETIQKSAVTADRRIEWRDQTFEARGIGELDISQHLPILQQVCMSVPQARHNVGAKVHFPASICHLFFRNRHSILFWRKDIFEGAIRIHTEAAWRKFVIVIVNSDDGAVAVHIWLVWAEGWILSAGAEWDEGLDAEAQLGRKDQGEEHRWQGEEEQQAQAERRHCC